MRNRLLIATALAVALVLGLVVGAWASIPSSDDRIHGCWSGTLTDDKNFRLLDDDQQDGQCPVGWTEISWQAD